MKGFFDYHYLVFLLVADIPFHLISKSFKGVEVKHAEGRKVADLIYIMEMKHTPRVFLLFFFAIFFWVKLTHPGEGALPAGSLNT